MATKLLGILFKVFDSLMRPTKIEYRVHNTPLEEYVHNWKHPIIVRRLASGTRAPKADEVQGEYKMGRLTYWAFYIGDTHAKEGRLIYIEKSDAEKLLKVFPNFFKLARQAVYLGSGLLPHGNTYGGKRNKNMRILVLKRGSKYQGMDIEDGSFIFDPKTIQQRGTPIKLGPTSNNFSIFQHLDWDKIAPDVRRMAEQLVDLVKNFDHSKLAHGKTVTYTDKQGVVHEVPGLGLDDQFKAMFLAINPQLAKHPWFVRGASSGTARWIASHAYAPYVSMSCYLAVAFEKWTLPKGKFIGYRHPVIAGASLHAMTVRKVVKLPDAVKGGAVARATGFWRDGEAFTMKGAGVIMPLPDGIDMVVCEDNIKIGRRLASDTVLEADCMVTIIQRYAKSALLGVPYKDFAKMNGDYDGDLVNILPANDIPLIYDNVKLHEKDGVNFKLPRKNADPWSRENVKKLLMNAMSSNMGWATVLHSLYLAKPQAEREALVEKLYPLCQDLAIAMGLSGKAEPSVDTCLAILQYYVQFNVEAIKNVDCDVLATYTAAARIQSLLVSWIGIKQPAWLSMRRAMEAGVMFQTSFPQYLDEMDPDVKTKLESSSKFKRQWAWKISGVEIAGSVPDECFRLNRAPLAQLWDEVVENPDPYAPYTYVPWVEPISLSQEKLGNELCDLFEQHIAVFEVARTQGNINLFDPEDVAIFRNQWRDICLQFADEHFNGDEELCARVLWRTSHERGENRLTGATFLGFPEEAKKIVVKWSGSINAHHCIIAGFKNMEIFKKGYLPNELQGTCKLITIEGKTCVRPIEPIRHHGERLFGYIADIEKGESQQGLSIPPDGTYSYKFKIRKSGTAYYATFDPITC